MENKITVKTFEVEEGVMRVKSGGAVFVDGDTYVVLDERWDRRAYCGRHNVRFAFGRRVSSGSAFYPSVYEVEGARPLESGVEPPSLGQCVKRQASNVRTANELRVSRSTFTFHVTNFERLTATSATPTRPRRVSRMPAITTTAPTCSGCNLSPRSTATKSPATNGVRFE